MHRSFLNIIFLLLAPTSPAAEACSYTEPPTLEEVVAQAEHVFVFRLMSAAYMREASEACGDCYSDWVEGKIAPLVTVKGEEPSTRSLRWLPQLCGGHRFDVGELYVAFASTNEPEIHLSPAERSIVFVSERLGLHDLETQPFIVDLRRSLEQGRLPRGFPTQNEADRTSTLPSGFPPKPMMPPN